MIREKFITQIFKSQAKEIYEYISKESLQNAEKFIENLLAEIQIIEKHRTSNPPITNFPNQLNRYRFKVYMKSFKIVYKVLADKLVFIGLLHTSQSNDAYKKLRTKITNNNFPYSSLLK